MKNIFLMGSAIAISSLVTWTSANAATLHVKNENKGPLDVVIEPAEGTVLPNRQELKYVLKAKAEKVIEVSDKDFPGDSTFSVTGKVSVPSLNNKCGPLSMDRAYTITFKPTVTGATECHVASRNR